MEASTETLSEDPGRTPSKRSLTDPQTPGEGGEEGRGDTAWTLPAVRRAVMLFLEFYSCDRDANAGFPLEEGATASPNPAIPHPGETPNDPNERLSREAASSTGLGFPLRDEGVAFFDLPEGGRVPRFDGRETAEAMGASFPTRIPRILPALWTAIEDGLWVLSGNPRRSRARAFSPLRSSVFMQTRLLIQLKTAAWMRGVADNLTQLQVLRAVRQLWELQGFMRVFHRETRAMRVEWHLLVATLALHLSVRDLPRGGGGDGGGGVVDAFFPHPGDPIAAENADDDTRKEEEETAAAEEGDFIAREVGLPMLHILAAERELQRRVAFAGVLSPGLLLVQLFKALALWWGAEGRGELELRREPDRWNRDFTRRRTRDAGDGIDPTTDEQTEETDANENEGEEEEEEEGPRKRSRFEPEGGGGSSLGFTLRRPSASRQRRCALALAPLLRALVRHHRENPPENGDDNGGEKSESEEGRGRGGGGGIAWSPLHRALLFLLVGAVARGEDRDASAARRAFRRAIGLSWRLLGPFHPCLADALVQLARISTEDDSAPCQIDENSSNNAGEASSLPATPASSSFSSSLTFFLNSLKEVNEGVEEETEGKEGRSPLVRIALEVAARASGSALFRLLGAFEEELSSPRKGILPGLPSSPLDAHFHQLFSEVSLRRIRQGWGVQLRRLCEDHVADETDAHQLPTEGPQRQDFVEVLLGFLPDPTA
ncbi:unnamed protein product [Phytomonas sp. EM1]|nr:unnamed protein product [Phytomonas sp. EM1]|eukprot:CCW64714.1 unnamed protein product [Phytomonas sp. isolate EM1]